MNRFSPQKTKNHKKLNRPGPPTLILKTLYKHQEMPVTKTLIRTISHAVTGSNFTYEIACYHTSKQNKAGYDIYHYIVTYFDPEGDEVIWTLKPKTYRSIANAERESDALCLEWTADDE